MNPPHHEIKHFYNTHYSATSDLARPQFQVRGQSVYATRFNKDQGHANLFPWFKIRGNKLIPTSHNPKGQGVSALPWYEIKGDQVHTTVHHPDGHKTFPVFEIKR